MDEGEDRGYSRAPRLEDLLLICRSLNEEGARYLLIGGFAVVLHGFVRATKDIDLLVEASPENVQRVKRALAVLPDHAAELIEDDEVRKYSVVRIADEVVVDLLENACGIDYDEARPGIERIEVEGVEIPVASKELLIRMKDTVRPSDHQDVEYLRLRLREEGSLN